MFTIEIGKELMKANEGQGLRITIDINLEQVLDDGSLIPVNYLPVDIANVNLSDYIEKDDGLSVKQILPAILPPYEEKDGVADPYALDAEDEDTQEQVISEK